MPHKTIPKTNLKQHKQISQFKPTNKFGFINKPIYTNDFIVVYHIVSCVPHYPNGIPKLLYDGATQTMVHFLSLNIIFHKIIQIYHFNSRCYSVTQFEKRGAAKVSQLMQHVRMT